MRIAISIPHHFDVALHSVTRGAEMDMWTALRQIHRAATP
jgi:hypothetical protein